MVETKKEYEEIFDKALAKQGLTHWYHAFCCEDPIHSHYIGKIIPKKFLGIPYKKRTKIAIITSKFKNETQKGFSLLRFNDLEVSVSQAYYKPIKKALEEIEKESGEKIFINLIN